MRVVDAERATDADPRRPLVLALVHRAHDEHVLDATPLQHPTEVPFADQTTLGRAGTHGLPLDIPGAHELAEQGEPVGKLRRGTLGAQPLEHRFVVVHVALPPDTGDWTAYGPRCALCGAVTGF